MRRYITNDTDQPRFIGGRLIPAGEGREIEADELPPEHAASDAEPPAATDDPEAARLANLQELLTQPLKDLTPQLADFGDETLAELARLEGEAAKPRTTLLSAIGDLQLSRAQQRAGGAPT